MKNPNRLLLLSALSVLACMLGGLSVGCIPSGPSTTSSISATTGTTETMRPPTATSVPQRRPLRVETVAEGLDFPAKMAVAPDGTIFFNELRNGKVRVIRDGRLVDGSFAEFVIVTLSETGLLGIALHPGYPEQPYVYVYVTQRVGGGIENRVVRISEVDGRGGARRVILRGIAAAQIHNGGELAFGPDGKLYISTGDAAERERSQRKSSPNGKILRLNPDGSIPRDNPFPGSPVYSLGHRNVFGMAFHPVTGELYITENGPESDDEINLVRPGRNYGWPHVQGDSADRRFVSPLRTYVGSIAPTGAAFIDRKEVYGAGYFANFIFGDFNDGNLHRLALNAGGTRVLSDRTLHTSPGGIYDVVSAPDGTLYFTTDSEILHLVPAND